MISKMPKLQIANMKSLFKSRRSALLIISCALLLAIGITLAWFTSNTTILGGELKLGALNVNLTVYKYDTSDNALHQVLAEGEEPSASYVRGIINEQNLHDETTGIRFIEVSNEGNIDAKTFLKFVCTANGIDEAALNYVYLRVSDKTSEVTGTLGEYAAVHHTAADASVIVADPESKTLTEMKTDQKIGDILSGETRYYVLEYCCSGMPTTYVDSLQTASVDIDAVLNVKQINAPDFEEEETGATFYPRDTESFIAYVSQATDGDTITLTDSIELPANYNLTFLRRVNLNLNGYSLTVHGNLAYDTANFGKCTLNVSGTSRLNIEGSLTIDTPNANFEIRGSSTRAIVLGKWDGVSDVCTGGEFEVNALRDPINDGYVQTNVNIIKKVYDTGVGAVVNVPASMSLRSNTKVKIVGSVTGDITAPAGTNNVWIESSGEIGFIDLSGMVAVGDVDNQIYVLNSNTFTNKYPAILLPEWARGAVSTGNSSVNTHLVNDAGAVNDWTVAIANTAYSAENKAEAESEFGASTVGNYWFWNCDIETAHPSAENKVVRNSDGDYTVYFYESDDRLGDLLADYYNGEGSAFRNESVTKLSLKTFDDGRVTSDDFAFIRGANDTFSLLETLDLSGAAMNNSEIPASAMEGEGALANVVFPITSVSIGSRAFYGTNVRFVSLPAHVTAIGTNAFVPGGDSRKVYVTWEPADLIPSAVLNGLTPSDTLLFMEKDVLLGGNYLSNPNWGDRVFEKYDVYDSNSNVFLQTTGASNAKLVCYDGDLGILNNSSGSIVKSQYTDTSTLNNYGVVGVGVNAFRIAIENINAQGASYATLLFPDTCTEVGDYAFAGIKLDSLALNNVNVIGAYAFSDSHIRYSAPRSASFAGMRSVGAYAFSNSILSPMNPSNVTPGLADLGIYTSSCINSGEFTGGTLDLSMRTAGAVSYDSTAINGMKTAGAVLKLHNVPRIDNITNHVTVLGGELDLSGSDLIASSAFSGSAPSTTTDLWKYNVLNITDVTGIEENAFANCHFGNVISGIEAGTAIDSNIYHMYSFRNSELLNVEISGILPDGTEGSNGGMFGRAVLGTVTADLTSQGQSAHLASSLFKCANSIDSLTVIANNNLEIGYAALYGKTNTPYTTVNNLNFVVPGELSVGKEAFAYTVFGNMSRRSSVSGQTEPFSPETIGDSAFYRTTLGAGFSFDLTTSIGNSAFVGATGLPATLYAPMLTQLDANAFKSCTVLTYIHMPVLQSVGASAFNGCSSLIKAKLSSVASIGNSAFANCSALKYLETSVLTTLGTSAVGGTPAFYVVNTSNVSVIPSSVKYPTNCTRILVNADYYSYYSSNANAVNTGSFGADDYRFISTGNQEFTAAEQYPVNCKYVYGERGGEASLIAFTRSTITGDYTTPDTLSVSNYPVVEIMPNAYMYTTFSNCNLTISDNTKIIGDKAFYNIRTGILSLTGASVRKIGNNSFYQCRGISWIKTPCLTSVGNSAFYDCGVSYLETSVLTSAGTSAFFGSTPTLYVVNTEKINDGTLPVPGNACAVVASRTLVESSYCGLYNSNYMGITNTGSYTASDYKYGAQSGESPVSSYIAGNYVYALDTNGDAVILTCLRNSISNSYTTPGTFTDSGETYQVKSIGGLAYCYTTFNNCDLTIDANTVSIGSSCFNNCTGILSVNAGGVKTIGSRAFYRCYSLISINAPALLTIGTESFYRCSALTSIDFELLESVPENAFYTCSDLQSVRLPSVKEIGVQAFASSGTLSYIETAPLTAIGTSAFYNTTVTVYVVNTVDSVRPSTALSVTSRIVLVNNGFYDLYSGSNVINTGSYSANDYRFALSDGTDTANRAEAVYIYATDSSECVLLASIYTSLSGEYQTPTSLGGRNVTRIGERAYLMTSFSSGSELVIAPNVTAIGKNAFSSKTGIVSVNAASVITVDNSAFSGCTSLVEALFGQSLTSFGTGVFSGCSSMNSLIINGAQEVTASGNLFGTNPTPPSGFKVYVPRSAYDSIYYVPADPLTTWGGFSVLDYFFYISRTASQTVGGATVNYWLSVVNGGYEINSIFTTAGEVSSLVIPDTLTAVENNETLNVVSLSVSAFNRVSSLTSVTLPQYLMTFNCAGGVPSTLQSYSVTAGNTSFSADADGVLYDDSGTVLVSYPAGRADTSYTVASSVVIIGTDAFSGVLNLESVTIDHMVYILDRAFSNCAQLSDLTFTCGLPQNISKFVGARTFENCGMNAGSIVVPANTLNLYKSGILYDGSAISMLSESADPASDGGMNVPMNAYRTLSEPEEETLQTGTVAGVLEIVRQPKDTVCIVGNETKRIEVEVDSGNAETVYQWYRTDENASEGGELIPGATDSFCEIDNSEPGTEYYYCIISAVGYNSAVSEPAKAFVSDGIVITGQPKDLDNMDDLDVYTFTVAAEYPHDAAIAYQWYVSDERSNEGGVAVEGANDPSLEIDRPDRETKYYYCVISADGLETVVSEPVCLEIVTDVETALKVTTGILGSGGIAIGLSAGFYSFFKKKKEQETEDAQKDGREDA